MNSENENVISPEADRLLKKLFDELTDSLIEKEVGQSMFYFLAFFHPGTHDLRKQDIYGKYRDDSFYLETFIIPIEEEREEFWDPQRFDVDDTAYSFFVETESELYALLMTIDLDSESFETELYYDASEAERWDYFRNSIA